MGINKKRNAYQTTQMKIFFPALFGLSSADIYLQFPGGSNNRLRETNSERSNDNRLFDSQNNGRQGFNQYGYYFYAGSTLEFQWTIQHSCGADANVNCNVVLQYACDDSIRDGETTRTINRENKDCKNYDCDSDHEYGMHEPQKNYKACALRERNKGLYDGERNINGETARFTRQEQNGARYGYECNEERDYYPYWTPTMWKDIAVLVNDMSETINGQPVCDFYKENSENVLGRAHCHIDNATWVDEKYALDDDDQAFIPNHEFACNQLAENDPLSQARWQQHDSHGLPEPDCLEHDYQRDNHHGNGNSDTFAGYKWKIPADLDEKKCIFRVRYNMTSNDYDGWTSDDKNEIRIYQAKLKELNPTANMDADFSTGKRKQYRKVHASLENSSEFKAGLRISNNAQITLTDKNGHGIEVILGGWGDRTNAIIEFDKNLGSKSTRKDAEKFLISTDADDSLSSRRWTNFTIDWSGNELTVTDHRKKQLIMVLQDYKQYFTDDIKNAYITSFGTGGFWRVDHDDTHTLSHGPDVWSHFGWNKTYARKRGYFYENDPQLQVFDDMDFEIAMAFNTDQVGRVFEDRTHTIAIRQPGEIIARHLRRSTMHNLNARGKLGNFVETYPNFEGTFAPNKVKAKKNDYVHIQFSGSNTNPDWEGSITDKEDEILDNLKRKDRYQLVLADDSTSYSASKTANQDIFGFSVWDAYHLMHGGHSYNSKQFSFDNEDEEIDNLRIPKRDFDIGIRRLTTVGDWDFFSPLNTRFGSRSMKGRVVVEDL